MRKRFWREFALILVIPGLLFAASCAKKQVGPTQEEIEAQHRAAEEARKAQEERFREKLLREGQPGEMERDAMAARERFENEDIHFEFDKSRLLPEAQEILKRKAAWLEAHPEAKVVVIEGHCDERGTSEYNMALGDRRAQSAKRFLVDLGIKADRLVPISYGEERPIDPRSNEDAWAKNRRAHFALD